MKRILGLCVLATVLYFVLCCDEETHYMKGEQCCKMCGKGTRMMVDDNCADPRCKECENGEYQSGYTADTKCLRQPSCDPNLHFKQVKNYNKTDRISCECESGYYCTAEDDCSTCRKHRVCVPGEEVKRQGSPHRDTVCEACAHGTFSTEESAASCQKWTECENGYHQETPGSSTSDRSCAASRVYSSAIVGVVVVLVLVVTVVAVFFIIKKGKSGCYQINHKHAFINTRPNEEVAIVVQPLSQQPQEDDDPVSPTPSNRTENGNVVEQEYGKEPFYPSHESNPHAHSLS